MTSNCLDLGLSLFLQWNVNSILLHLRCGRIYRQPEAGKVSTVDPLARPAVVEVRSYLGPEDRRLVIVLAEISAQICLYLS